MLLMDIISIYNILNNRKLKKVKSMLVYQYLNGLIDLFIKEFQLIKFKN